MTEMANSIGNFGVLVIIAGIFLYDHLVNNKKMQQSIDTSNKLLEEMKKQNENISTSLDLLRVNQQNYTEMTQRVEKKIDCIKEKADIAKKEK